MSKRLYLLIAASVAMCGLLLAAVLAPLGSSRASARAPGLIVEAPAEAPAGMVWVPGGSFLMGTNEYYPPTRENPDRIKLDEYPAHPVELDGYWMDETPVTNRQFAEFVAMTGYVTLAERELTKSDFEARGVDTTQFPTESVPPGSMCFNPEFDRTQLVTGVPGWEHQVWKIVDGADWQHPEGPGSSIEDRMDHPVVHIAWEDAVAYLKWAGKRLPTEAEFEYASRSAGQDRVYPWGEELAPGGSFLANYWQGEFPVERKNEDGWLTTSPVKTYPANDLGLFDMAGNVWEWCSDLYDAEYYQTSPRRNPQGPAVSFDPQLPGLTVRVQRGGSFLCNYNNCTSYRTRARGRGDVASSSYHNGFRGVVDSAGREEYERAQAEIRKWRESQAGQDS